MKTPLLACLALIVPVAFAASATQQRAEKPKDEPKPTDVMSAETFVGLKLRAIGPALTSGRIGDFAVDPKHPGRYFVAVASGGVWKTVNDGTTWTAVFDREGSYSIGCVTMGPSNPNTVWVGTGENNSQRSVGWGDGVYRSDDGGQHWQNMGLKHSEHIGKILVDPRDSNVVWVAAQGPLWGPGGDRGLYRSADGGKNWTASLKISEDTGISDVVMDPRNPDLLYASAYQRRRHVWTMINGGPESAIYKTTDGGKNWRKVSEGLPKDVDLGRIGLAVSPADPDVVYAIVEAAETKSGFFRSQDRGETWEKRCDYKTTSGQYYQEIFCDPKNVDRIYSMDTWLHVTEDGGKTFHKLGEKAKHVDNHAMWIEPSDTDHLLVGCDGGIYETWDRGATWQFKVNLSVTQFYRVAVDGTLPFYYVYGGTQDNYSLGGPSRTNTLNGITNADWFVTTGGDGFFSRIDPTDPAIVYAESQYGGLVRYDRRSGEEVDIKPREGKDDPPLRWNWDSPLIISPHSHTRLYYAANKLFRSDDRGNTWKAISGDLSRGIDRNTLPVMGKVWPADAVAKNASTSFYGNAVALSESPFVEGLLYVGTDDGLVHVSEDGGTTWRNDATFPGVPERTFVSRLEASRHAKDVVFAAFDNHKNADFKPYLLRSADRGRSWTSVAGDLPAGEVVYAVIEDSKEPNLLFAGCEYGAYFSADGGAHWIKLKGGMPTIEVRDLTMQTREGDLVLATFGRGFYILDDVSPLRGLSRAELEKNAVLFPVKDAPAYIEKSLIGGRGKSFQGDTYFTADNPPFGAVFTYYLKDEFKTRKELRHDAEKAAAKKGVAPPYPTPEQLREEAQEEKPAVILTVSDGEGHVVRRIVGETDKGFHRIAWDLRFPASVPADPEADKKEMEPWDAPDRGPMAVPGTYRVSLASRVAGVTTELAGPQTFSVVPLGLATLKATDQASVLAFEQKTARLQRAVLGAEAVVKDAKDRIEKIEFSLRDTPAARSELLDQAEAIRSRLFVIGTALSGDRVMARRDEPTKPGIAERVQNVVASQWATTQAPTTTMLDAYAIAADEFAPILASLRTLVDVDLKRLDDALEKAGAPWTPGRVPVWTRE
ncbi:MAG: glycosyl hydrolase [Acidobacteriia bacterium]|nr:glycosyl hydrolase [Terriglobia bacterium]